MLGCRHGRVLEVPVLALSPITHSLQIFSDLLRACVVQGFGGGHGLFLNPSPLLVIDYISAPNIQGYQNGTLIWELFTYCSPFMIEAQGDHVAASSCFEGNASDLFPRHTVDTTLPAVAVRL